MDFYSLFELLKLFWLMFEVVRYIMHRQKEKALVDSVESFNQRLLLLEKSLPEKSDID
jgi:hypothetical protein